MAKNPWLELVKQMFKKVKAEGKVKGRDIMKEAIKRAKVIWEKKKREEGKKKSK